MTKAEIGAKIKEQREAKGWSQKQLADAIDTHTQRIPGIESGKTNTTIDRLILICNVIGLSIEANEQRASANPR